MGTAIVIMRFDTVDFDRWRTTCGSSQPPGASGIRVYRDVDVPSQVFAVIEWDDAERARAYVDDAQTKARMLQTGVVGLPDISLVREIR